MTAETKYPSVLVGQLFPNPPMEDGRVYLACVGHLAHAVGIEVRSPAGEIVHTSAHGLPRSGGTVKLDFSQLPPGGYEVIIRCGGHVEQRSLSITAPKKTWSWKTLFSLRH